MLEFTITFSLQVLRIAIPYLLAALGATYSERSGVINLALEGLMIFGAFGAVIGQYFTGSAWLGLMLAILLGLSVASLHGFVTITIKANQIVSGVALNILAVGVTKFFLRPLFGSSSNSERIAGIDVPSILLNPIFLLAVVLVPLSHFIFYYTPFGLRLRAVGESAQTADSLGHQRQCNALQWRDDFRRAGSTGWRISGLRATQLHRWHDGRARLHRLSRYDYRQMDPAGRRRRKPIFCLHRSCAA
jgi:ABC-type uncharacterized transport system permease subunit